MYNEQIDYTIASTDPEHYNRIDVSIPGPPTRYMKMMTTSLVTNCNILVLTPDDYIRINAVTYKFTSDYTELNLETFTSLLNSIIGQSSSSVTTFTVTHDYANRLIISSSEKFVINECSYNVLILTGLYSTNFPITSDAIEGASTTTYRVRASSVGYFLSTPILYLVSNVGVQSFRQRGRRLAVLEKDEDIKKMSSSRVVLRVTNSFSANYPIVANNADFEVTTNSNDLSNLEFTLIDANGQEVRLLNPMYVTIKVLPVPDEELWQLDKRIMIPGLEWQEANKNMTVARLQEKMSHLEDDVNKQAQKQQERERQEQMEKQLRYEMSQLTNK